MMRYLLVFGIFMVWFVWARHYYLCNIKGMCHESIETVDSSKFYHVAHTLTVKAGNAIVIENYPQFVFDNSSAEPIFVDGHEDLLKELSVMMQQQPQAELLITGRYLASEHSAAQAQGRYHNLGEARALAVADKLVHEYQISDTRIRTHFQQMVEDTLDEPISFELLNFTPIASNTNAVDAQTPIATQPQPDTSLLKQVQTDIADVTYFDKSTNFDYGSQNFSPSGDFKIYVDSLKSYAKRNPKHSLVITGHTDSKGDAKFNQQLGLKRANAVRAYLKKQGIKLTIDTKSKGESELITNDQNADGSYNSDAMTKNRRVNIKIIQQ